MNIPLIFSFWFMVAAYVIHVIDESLLGGSFVEKVREHWWPEYSWRKFFWFNTGYFVLMIASVVVYDLRGGSWLILPLGWAIERLCNGFWHVWWAIRFRESGASFRTPEVEGDAYASGAGERGQTSLVYIAKASDEWRPYKGGTSSGSETRGNAPLVAPRPKR